MDAVKTSPNDIVVLMQRKIAHYRNGKPVSCESQAGIIMPDSYIDQKAAIEGYQKYYNSPMRKVERAGFYLGLPLISSIAAGAMQTDKTIGKKVIASLSTAKSWGIMLLGLLGTFKAVDFATKKIPLLRKVREDYPTSTSLGVGVAALGVGLGTEKVISWTGNETKIGKEGKSLTSIVTDKASELAQKLETKKLGTHLDNKLFKPIGEFFTQNVVGKQIAEHRFIAPLIAIGLVIGAKSIIDRQIIKHNQKKIRNELLQEKGKALLACG